MFARTYVCMRVRDSSTQHCIFLQRSVRPIRLLRAFFIWNAGPCLACACCCVLAPPCVATPRKLFLAVSASLLPACLQLSRERFARFVPAACVSARSCTREGSCRDRLLSFGLFRRLVFFRYFSSRNPAIDCCFPRQQSMRQAARGRAHLGPASQHPLPASQPASQNSLALSI